MGISKKDKVRRMFDNYVNDSGVNLYSYDHPFRELWNTLTQDQVKRLTAMQLWEYLLKDKLQGLMDPNRFFGNSRIQRYDKETNIIQNQSRFLDILA